MRGDFTPFIRKNVFFDLHQEQVDRYTQLKMYSTLKTHILTKSTNFGKKSRNDQKIFSISVKKHFAEKSFSVFGGAHGRPLNTLKLFFGKMFYCFVLHAFEKYVCLHLKKNHKNLPVLSSNLAILF